MSQLESIVRSTLWMVLIAAIGAGEANAERRVALVIGNSSYSNVASLPNARTDSEAVAAMFKAASFDVVTIRNNVGIGPMRRAIGDFAEVASDADIAVIYFAGHGVEIDGTNYLIPVDARLARDLDVEDESVSLDRLFRAVEGSRRLRLIILDACRDNPFLASMKKSVASRSITRGLAKVEPMVGDTLVAFASKAGSVALDGDGKNSPFTAALVNHLTVPGLDIRIAFGRVRDEVVVATARKQEPFVYGSLGGQTVALVSLPEKKPQVSTAPVSVVPSANSLPAVVAAMMPNSARSLQNAVAYDAAQGHKAFAVSPGSGTWRRTAMEYTRNVGEEVLEGCQLAYGKPCALVAVDGTVLAEAAGG
ncbi:MAG: caspase family protein, partial [Casimicrobiaceae bacterium]